ncbi:MAG: type II toxin-antitoxin system prevent-host-death family antitoxin [Oceanipulchritudo sp.]
MKETIGIFEAKTKLSELCTRVEEGSAEYVITRRGRAVARIVPMQEDRAGRGHGIRERMRLTEHQHGSLAEAEADFPDVWKARLGSRQNPLEELEDSGSGQ